MILLPSFRKEVGHVPLGYPIPDTWETAQIDRVQERSPDVDDLKIEIIGHGADEVGLADPRRTRDEGRDPARDNGLSHTVLS